MSLLSWQPQKALRRFSIFQFPLRDCGLSICSKYCSEMRRCFHLIMTPNAQIWVLAQMKAYDMPFEGMQPLAFWSTFHLRRLFSITLMCVFVPFSWYYVFHSHIECFLSRREQVVRVSRGALAPHVGISWRVTYCQPPWEFHPPFSLGLWELSGDVIVRN